MPKILIIGAGIAGYSVAAGIRQQDKDLQVTLTSEERFLPYNKELLLDLFAGSIKREDIFLASEAFLKDNNISFIYDSKVTALNFSRKTAYFKEKGSIEYDFLVISVDRKIILPEIPGIKKEGVFSFGSLPELDAISKYFIVDQVCVVGSDNNSLKLAQIMQEKYKAEVKLISRGGLEPSMAGEGIEIINSMPVELIGEGQAQAVKLESGKIIAASIVVFMDEYKPNTDFLKNSGLELSEGNIVVNELMQANKENIFVCGESVVVKDKAAAEIMQDTYKAQASILVSNLLKSIRGEACRMY